MIQNKDHLKLKQLAEAASKNAHAPYSGFHIGSSVLMESGNFYSGCNVENSSYGGTVCAERVAIFNAISSGEKEIKKIYIYSEGGWPPCGMCRQVISEFAANDLEVIIGDNNGNEKIIPFKDIFPMGFTPDKLVK